MNEIDLAMRGLSAAKTMLDGFVAFRDATKVLELKTTLFREIYHAQQAALVLQKRVLALEQELADLKKHQALAQQRDLDLQRYEAFQPAPAVLVYALKPSDGSVPQPPYLCQACYEKRIKSFLSFEKATSPTQPAALQCPEHGGHRFQLPRGFKVHMLGAQRAT